VTLKTIEQQRAKAAFDVVCGMVGRPGAKEFGREAKKLPVRILTSGLGQAVCFLEAKKRAPVLREALSAWIAKRIEPAKGSSQDDLLGRIREGDARFLQMATAESLAYLQWLVRFAEAKGLVGDED